MRRIIGLLVVVFLTSSTAPALVIQGQRFDAEALVQQGMSGTGGQIGNVLQMVAVGQCADDGSAFATENGMAIISADAKQGGEDFAGSQLVAVDAEGNQCQLADAGYYGPCDDPIFQSQSLNASIVTVNERCGPGIGGQISTGGVVAGLNQTAVTPNAMASETAVIGAVTFTAQFGENVNQVQISSVEASTNQMQIVN